MAQIIAYDKDTGVAVSPVVRSTSSPSRTAYASPAPLIHIDLDRIDDVVPGSGSGSFFVSVPLANLDTHFAARDNDLKGPDWFNARQFPTIEFKSSSAKKTGDDSFGLTGDLMIHGVTKSVTIPMQMTGTGKGMKGETRTGFEGTFTIKRSDFDMKTMPQAVGDDVRIVVALETIKQ